MLERSKCKDITVTIYLPGHLLQLKPQFVPMKLEFLRHSPDFVQLLHDCTLSLK